MENLNKVIEFTKDLNILFVEDDKSARTSTILLLEEFFKKIDVATNGEEGLNYFKNNIEDIDMIITDINMPKLSGLDMIEEIRKIDANIPIVIFSAHYESEYFIRSIYADVQGYVIKPIDMEQFIRVLDKIIVKIKLLEAEEKLKEQYQYLHSIINRIEDPIMVIKEDYSIALMNDISKEKINSDKVADIDSPKCYEVSHYRSTPCDGISHPCPLSMVIETQTRATVVHQHYDEYGNRYYVELIATPLLNEKQECIGIIESSRDITQYLDTQERLERQKELLAYQANHDGLTELANRNFFNEKLIATSQKDERFALFFIDLDKFKIINDTVGHKAGDSVLIEASSRMSDTLGEHDILARLGGDEFTMIIKNLLTTDELLDRAKDILNALKEPIYYEEHTLFISCSIGISIYPDDSLDTSTLLKYADEAMYEAKKRGRDNVQLYQNLKRD